MKKTGILPTELFDAFNEIKPTVQSVLKTAYHFLITNDIFCC